MSLTIPALNRSYANNQKFSLTTPEIRLSDEGYTCIIGSNGSGKSSFGEALSAANSGDDEKIWFYLPQYLDRFLFAENIVEQLEVLLARPVDRDLLKQVLHDLGFSDTSNIIEFPFILMSGGERRRIALACVFYLEPKYLILDEADIGITQKENMVLLSKIHNLKALGTRVILISHNYEFVKGSSDLICLKDGRLDQSGETGSLLADPDFQLKNYGVRFQKQDD